jgi:hypothetical protein
MAPVVSGRCCLLPGGWVQFPCHASHGSRMMGGPRWGLFWCVFASSLWCRAASSASLAPTCPALPPPPPHSCVGALHIVCSKQCRDCVLTWGHCGHALAPVLMSLSRLLGQCLAAEPEVRPKLPVLLAAFRDLLVREEGEERAAGVFGGGIGGVGGASGLSTSTRAGPMVSVLAPRSSTSHHHDTLAGHQSSHHHDTLAGHQRQPKLRASESAHRAQASFVGVLEHVSITLTILWAICLQLPEASCAACPPYMASAPGAASCLPMCPVSEQLTLGCALCAEGERQGVWEPDSLSFHGCSCVCDACAEPT